MSLGRPSRGLTLDNLYPESGKGNSLTCFATLAVYDWQENIPAFPCQMSRRDRRELICHLANCSHIDVLEMMAVILLKKREARVKNSEKMMA